MQETIMTGPAREILLTTAPLIPPPPSFSPTAGGMLDFYGVVRGHEGGESIIGIDYEAYVAMARRQLDLLAEEAYGKYPLLGLILHHRIGFVAAAEPSLFLRVSAAHRGPAFEAAQWLIEQLKLRVPIWKHPRRESGPGLAEPEAGGSRPIEDHQSHGESSPDSVA